MTGNDAYTAARETVERLLEAGPDQAAAVVDAVHEHDDPDDWVEDALLAVIARRRLAGPSTEGTVDDLMTAVAAVDNEDADGRATRWLAEQFDRGPVRELVTLDADQIADTAVLLAGVASRLGWLPPGVGVAHVIAVAHRAARVVVNAAIIGDADPDFVAALAEWADDPTAELDGREMMMIAVDRLGPLAPEEVTWALGDL